MSEVIVSLNISSDEFIKHYQGSGRCVFTHTLEGQSIRFPANILQPYVTHSGVNGTFKIVFSSDNKFQSIHRISHH